MSIAINRELSGDPTRTHTIREQYASRLRGWFSDLNTEIRRGITERDIFAMNQEVTPPPVFRFRTDDRQIDGFMDWIDTQEREGVLEITNRNDNTFIRSAYSRGITDADTHLRQEGADVDTDIAAALQMPQHQDTLQLLYTRNFNELNGITNEMNREISRTLVSGMTEGAGAHELARGITDHVDGIGKRRATIMARTEVINAYTEGTLTRFEQMGVDTVEVRAEWGVAGDERTCPICQSLEGNIYTIEQMRTDTFVFDENEFPLRPPIHPQCRCVLLPITDPSKFRSQRGPPGDFQQIAGEELEFFDSPEELMADSAARAQVFDQYRRLLASNATDDEIARALQSTNLADELLDSGRVSRFIDETATLPGTGKSITGKDWDLYDEAKTSFIQRTSREDFDRVEEIGRAWASSWDRPPSAPIWQEAIDKTNNRFLVPPRVEAAFDEISDRDRELVQHWFNTNQEMVRKHYGNQIPVVRGMKGLDDDIIDDVRAAKEAGETVSFNHKPIESYSVDPGIGMLFSRRRTQDGLLIQRTVEPEEVAWSGMFDNLYDGESEFVILNELGKDYDPDDIHITGDMTDADRVNIIRRIIKTFS